MSVFIRSLVNRSQTIDSVALAAFALQERGNATTAIIAAEAAGTINYWAHGGDAKPQPSWEEYVPVTTDVIDLPDYAEDVSILPAGTIAAMTLRMPVSPANGQVVRVAFDQIITTLTHQVGTSSGHTLKGALTAATAKGFGSWKFRKSNLTWYRVG